MRIRIKNKAYYVTKEEVRRKLSKVEPEPGQRYFIKIKGRLYPIKQVVTEVFSIPKAEYNSQEAYRVVKNLGFKILIER